jgi:glycosyltransferase involved in cell wall biosynthesis
MDGSVSRGAIPTHRIAVLIPTYRRPNDLRRCLAALHRQTRPADQVIVVRRDHDAATLEVLAEPSGFAIQVAVVSKPGVIHALTCGIEVVGTDLVAMTDDDATPREDWLERIEQTFREGHRIAGVGGRDAIPDQDVSALGSRGVVGKVRWYGKVIGNHHLGCGPARDVDVLKGVNHAYRVDLLRQVWFDLRLRGQGAQVHFELAIGLDLVGRDWRLVYNPAILVDHFPAPRHDDDQRGTVHPAALGNEIHNETLALLRHLPPLRRLAFLGWSLLCGTRAYPGGLCWLIEFTRGRPGMNLRLSVALRGRWHGLLSWLNERPSRAPRVWTPLRRQETP